MSKARTLELALGGLVTALAEESKHFVCNKGESHRFTAEVFCSLTIITAAPL